MKTHLLLLLIASLLFACSSGNDPKESKASSAIEDDRPKQIILSFTAKYTASIGWADIYQCKIKSVDQDSFLDTVVYLRIFPGRDEQIEGSHTAKFNLIANDTTNRTFQGFIDSKDRNWELKFFDDKAF